MEEIILEHDKSKIKLKIISYALITFLFSFIFVGKVYAKDYLFGEEYYDSCVSAGTCTLVCGYQVHYFKAFLDSAIFGIGDEEWIGSVYVYRNNNGTFDVSTWNKHDSNGRKRAATDGNIYWERVLSEGGTCPEKAHISLTGSGNQSRVCFDGAGSIHCKGVNGDFQYSSSTTKHEVNVNLNAKTYKYFSGHFSTTSGVIFVHVCDNSKTIAVQATYSSSALTTAFDLTKNHNLTYSMFENGYLPYIYNYGEYNKYFDIRSSGTDNEKVDYVGQVTTPSYNCLNPPTNPNGNTESIPGAAIQPLSIVTDSFADAEIEKNVSFLLYGTGGTIPFNWTVSNLPPGLTGSGGIIYGNPTTVGTWQVQITVTDSNGQSASKTIPFSVTWPSSMSTKPVDCGIFEGEFGDLIRDTLNFIRYLAPILVIVFSTIDFFKATASQDKDELKKAQGKAVKRLIIAVILFFIPLIINLLLGLFSGIIGSHGTCGF